MNLVLIGILASEIGFWVVLILGLATRYLLRWRKVSTILLLGVPVLDVFLLSLISWDLLVNETIADFTHGLGAVYLGFTIAFGRQIISRVDAWFAYRFASGPEPKAPPKVGIGRVKYEWEQWLKMLLCAVIASVVLVAITLLVRDPARTSELTSWLARIWLVTGIWFIGWPVWYSIGHVLRGPESRSSG